MSERRNLCPHGGSLVGGDEWLPVEAFDFNWVTSHPYIGCNQLRCGACGAVVRHALGFDVPPDRRDTLSPAVLYASPDWKVVADVWYSPGEKSRLYVCRCRYKVERGLSDLDRPEIDPIRGFISEWRCAGHPTLPVPATLDGAAIGPGTDFDAAAAAALASPTAMLPAGVAPDVVRAPALWLGRLYALLAASDAPQLAREVALAASRQLSAADVVVRRGAIEFFFKHAWAPGAERLAELVRDQVGLFTGVPDPVAPGSDLLSAAFRTLQARLLRGDAARDPAIIEVMRAELLRGGASSRMALHTLADVDHSWVVDHAMDIATAAPAVVPSLVHLLREQPTDWLCQTLAKIAQLPGVKAETVRKEINRRIAEPARSTILAAIGAA